MPKGPWTQLRDRLLSIRRSGIPLRDTDGSDIGDAAFPAVKFFRYPFVKGRVMDRIQDWLRDAETMLLDAGRNGDQQRLDLIVNSYTGLSLSRINHLSLQHFAPPERDADEFDPLEARLGFHLFLCTLIDEAAYYARVSGAAKRRLPSLDEEFWTREQYADFRGITPASVSKEISEHRRNNGGRDPVWVRRFPGKQRGFLVKRATYMAMMKKGEAPAPRRYSC